MSELETETIAAQVSNLEAALRRELGLRSKINALQRVLTSVSKERLRLQRWLKANPEK
jgi:hypothetical protein